MNLNHQDTTFFFFKLHWGYLEYAEIDKGVGMSSLLLCGSPLHLSLAFFLT